MPATLKHLTRRFANPSWIAKKLFLWGVSVRRLESNHVICAFYPKTGSTWVRIFMYNLLSAEQKQKDEGFNFDEVDSSMPEWGHVSFLHQWPFQNCPCLIKSHRPYNWFFRKNRVALFIREPRDVMVSYWHYAKAKKELNFEGSLKDLVYDPEKGLRNYMSFYRSWKDRAGILIRYEDLRANPHETFKRFIDFIGVDATSQQIQQALEASSLEKTRTAQEQSSSKFRSTFKGEYAFARKGSTGEGMMQFDEELDELLARGESIADIKALAVKKGFKSMKDDGIIKVLEGLTSREALAKVVDINK